MTNASELNEESSEGVKISDKRRIDPQTGQPRDESAAEQNSGETSAETPDKVSELTADLQRITAEYANYRKRVDRDRELIRDMSTSVALEQLIPILDDISRAREHGDLTGTFSTVADALSTVTKRLGLVEFGKLMKTLIQVFMKHFPRWKMIQFNLKKLAQLPKLVTKLEKEFCALHV